MLVQVSTDLCNHMAFIGVWKWDEVRIKLSMLRLDGIVLGQAHGCVQFPRCQDSENGSLAFYDQAFAI